MVNIDWNGLAMAIATLIGWITGSGIVIVAYRVTFRRWPWTPR